MQRWPEYGDKGSSEPAARCPATHPIHTSSGTFLTRPQTHTRSTGVPRTPREDELHGRHSDSPTVLQSIQHHVRDGLQIALDLLLASLRDVRDQDVHGTSNLPVRRLVARHDQLGRWLVHRSMQRIGEIRHHLPHTHPLSLP